MASSPFIKMCTMFQTSLATVFVAFTLALLPRAAVAQSTQLWLEAAYSDDGSENVGPAEAAGAVIWSHGRSLDTEDYIAPTPPYIFKLREDGWDTFRFNRMRTADRLTSSSLRLVDEVHHLKQLGYRRVVLAGQSFGAFLSLIAADSSEEVDTVIATAPAAYGSYSEIGNSWRNNATKLYPLLQGVRHARVMLFYFRNDDFDPGGRGEESRLVLEHRHLPYVVVDQPPRLASHWAASTVQFARLYGNCIRGFLEAALINEGAQCHGDAFWAGNMTTTTVEVGLPKTAAVIQPVAR